ncbi:MAG TPA: glycosyltransferase [Isosphaeraceae bacterium]|nr:glycosyltransferase [Isosphaeraceae bacterium]
MSTATMPAGWTEGTRTIGRRDGLALAVADVCWPSTENLFREIDRDSVAVLMLKCLDYVNAWRRGWYPWSPGCRLRQSGPAAWDQHFVLPSGWMKRYPRMGMRPIARSIRSWWRRLPGARRGLVMSYPQYLYLHQQLQPDVSIYYNIDDYALYWPREAERVRELERAVVRAADLTVCVSRLRAGELRAAVPEAAGRIHYVPHGAPTPFLAARPLVHPAEAPADVAHLPRPLLGYIGMMEDRVDWELMDRLSREFPRASIVVVGPRSATVAQPWWESCARFLARPNVHVIGRRPQEMLARYYQSFDISLIPYQIDHAFNQACNPTKLMDTMGSGRPIVATALPECRLHAERVHLAEDADEFLGAVRRILDQDCDDGKAALRHAFALANTCHVMSERVLDLIAVASGG